MFVKQQLITGTNNLPSCAKSRILFAIFMSNKKKEKGSRRKKMILNHFFLPNLISNREPGGEAVKF